MTMLLLLFLLFACSSTKTTTSRPADLSPADIALSQNAKLLDDYVHEKMTPEQLAQIKDGCKKAPDANIFCYSFTHLDALDREIRLRTRVVAPPEVRHPKVIVPLPPVVAGEKIRNWKALKKAKVEVLLKGLQGKPKELVELLKRRALADDTCPNRIAVAVGAMLEDYLPDGVDQRELARLYEKGGRCAVKTPSDHEAYLTRAGLFNYASKEFAKAETDFSQSATSDGVYTGRALYWLYRTRKRLANADGAKAAADQLTSRYPFAFHTLLVASDGNEDPGSVLLRQPLTPIAARRSLRVPAINPLAEQAEALKRFGFDDSAAIMVSWALDAAPRLENEVKIYLASLGDAHTQVTLIPDMLSQYPTLVTRDTMELLFPRNLYALFEKNAGGVDPYLLLSVAKQESTFNPRAISPANAQGLLQLNPVTAKQMTNGSVSNLLDPQVNIALGARLLSSLIRDNRGQIYLALAAYNAGQDKVVAWRRQFPTEDSILFIDLISYRETRGYVASVLRNYFWYRRLAEPSEFALKRIVNSGVGPLE